MKREYKQLGPYLLLWSTQSLSTLGSAMTGYTLVLWLYLKSGSAMQTALLSVCSYAPYVIMSIFAGALSDRWNKKRTMLICDLIAALSTLCVLFLIKTGNLRVIHLYALNALSGLMNTVQQPAGEVTATLLTPEKYYQKTSALRSLSQSMNTILTPVIATALFTVVGIEAVIAADLISFAIAFITLLFFISIPETGFENTQAENVLASARGGLVWLRHNPLILNLILFLAFINLIASIYNVALPAMILSKANGGEAILGLINACVGLACLGGSLLAALAPAPRNRVRAICLSLFLAMSTENFMLAFGNSPAVWCAGAVLGWLMIPFMNANMDVIFRSTIPAQMQGRVYSCRNTLQFFTIPLGYLLGGVLVDRVFEPIITASSAGSVVARLFGTEKGAGCALLFFFAGLAGVLVCVAFSLILRRYRWNERDKI